MGNIIQKNKYESINNDEEYPINIKDHKINKKITNYTIQNEIIEEYENSHNLSNLISHDIDILNISNIAILVSYFLVGFEESILITPLSMFLVNHLDDSPKLQTTIIIIQTLPWSFKLIYGFFSDLIPINGYHRKPWMIIGYSLFSFSLLYLSLFKDLNSTNIALYLFLSKFGLICADVIGDTLVVEKSKHNEKEEDTGQLQATCYVTRFFGSLIGAIIGSLIYDKGDLFWFSFREILFGVGILPIIILFPLIYFLKEEKNLNPKTMDKQFHDIWLTICKKSVYRPIAFIFLFNLFQIPNIAWQSYLILTLNFTSTTLGIFQIAGALMTFIGLLMYKKYFFHASWRSVYTYSVLLASLFNIFQLLLIFQINKKIGIPNTIFALGDNVIGAYISGIQFLPMSQLFIRVSEDGSEGASYAILTTFSNIGLLLANTIGTYFGDIWDVSNDALREGDINGLWKLDLLTSLLPPLPLLLIFLLPSNHYEQKLLENDPHKSIWGGRIFLFTLITCLLIILIQAIVNLI